MATTGGGETSYPSMPAPRDEGLGWPKGAPLTAVTDPVAARTALAARAATSVIDPAGLRRWWIGDLVGLVIAELIVGGFADLLGVGLNWPVPTFVYLLPLILLANLWRGHLLSRALPLPGVIPWRPLARVRWHVCVRRDPAEVPEPAEWPAGSESLAVLVAAEGATSLAPSWAGERVGVVPETSRQWVAALLREGWLNGGGRVLGWARLPEFHVSLTDEGRERLDTEVNRLRGLAGQVTGN